MEKKHRRRRAKKRSSWDSSDFEYEEEQRQPQLTNFPIIPSSLLTTHSSAPMKMSIPPSESSRHQFGKSSQSQTSAEIDHFSVDVPGPFVTQEILSDGKSNSKRHPPSDSKSHQGPSSQSQSCCSCECKLSFLFS
jgi:hypothetical protein